MTLPTCRQMLLMLMHSALKELIVLQYSPSAQAEMTKCPKLSEAEKIEIIGRVEHGGESKRHVALSMKRSWRAVDGCIKNYHETASLKSKPGRGRKQVLSDDTCALATELLTCGRFAGAREVAAELYRLGKTIKLVFRTTITRSVKAYCKKHELPGITAAHTAPKKKLTEEQKAARLQFCLENRDRDWRQVMFTDRCKFHLAYPGVKVTRCAWRRVGETVEVFKVNKAATFNVYAGITPYGATKMHTCSCWHNKPRIKEEI